jgi:hypothetical protein
MLGLVFSLVEPNARFTDGRVDSRLFNYVLGNDFATW